MGDIRDIPGDRGLCGKEESMLHFMIDFENVGNNGLAGSEYLSGQDRVTIFYSAVCVQVENGRMEQILNSGCGLDLCKLQKQGKNGLDFYIASRIGEIYGSGYEGDVSIISKDKGFRAVQDYWRRAKEPRKIVLKPDIEQSIVSSGEISERSRLIREKKKIVGLESTVKTYQERRRIQTELGNLFADTEYIAQIGTIMEMILVKSTPKVLYLDILKRFGKKDGLLIYNVVKKIV